MHWFSQSSSILVVTTPNGHGFTAHHKAGRDTEWLPWHIPVNPISSNILGSTLFLVKQEGITAFPFKSSSSSENPECDVTQSSNAK